MSFPDVFRMRCSKAPDFYRISSGITPNRVWIRHTTWVLSLTTGCPDLIKCVIGTEKNLINVGAHPRICQSVKIVHKLVIRSSPYIVRIRTRYGCITLNLINIPAQSLPQLQLFRWTELDTNTHWGR